MIITVTPNPALDKLYWVRELSRDPETHLTRAYKSAISPGGKGVNVSLMLAQLGVESIALGFAAGYTGRVLVSQLREAGVTTDFVWVHGETRTNVVILEEGREASPIEVDEPGPVVPERAAGQLLRRLERALRRARYLVLGGSLPPGLPSSFYEEAVRLARSRDVKVVINAAGEPLARAMAAGPYLVKPDIRERKEFRGREITDRGRLIELCKGALAPADSRDRDGGAEAVLISHEITGDLLVTREGVWDFIAEEVDFKNIVGAEDALVGGIILGLLEGAPLEEAAHLGMAAAIVAAESPKIVEVDRAKIEQSRAKVKVVKLE